MTPAVATMVPDGLSAKVLTELGTAADAGGILVGPRGSVFGDAEGLTLPGFREESVGKGVSEILGLLLLLCVTDSNEVEEIVLLGTVGEVTGEAMGADSLTVSKASDRRGRDVGNSMEK